MENPQPKPTTGHLESYVLKELLKIENCKFGYKLMNSSLPPRICELAATDQNGKSLNKLHPYNTRKKTSSQ